MRELLFYVQLFVQTAMPVLVAIGLGVLLPLAGMRLYSTLGAGFVLMVVVLLIDAVFIGNTRLNLGVNLTLNDLVFLLLGAVALLRWMFARDVPLRSLLWLAFVALYLLGLGLGLASYGTRAGVQARDYFYAIVAASYTMSFAVDEAQVQRVLRSLAASAWVLIPLCLYRWAVAYLPVPALLPPGGVWSADGPTRVIASNETLVLAQLLLLGLMFNKPQPGMRPLRLATPFLMAAVVALQHRSVWVATLVGGVCALALARSSKGSPVGQLAALVVVVSLTALPVVMSERLAAVSREVGQSAATALAGQGSVHARMEDWQQLLREWSRAGPREWAIGYGFGRDTTRFVSTESGQQHLVRFGAHNHYLAILLNTGMLGLAAFLALAAWLLKNLYGLCRAGQGGMAAPLLLTLVIMQLAYYVPYAADYVQHALLGVAVAFVATQRRGAAPLPMRHQMRSA